MKKALPIFVYRHKDGGCTNHGISDKHDTLLLICDAGYVDIDENNPPENAVKIVTKNFSFGTFKHLEPLKRPDSGNVGWMHGGNFGFTSDSRFRDLSEYPLPIHDRQENQELNDILSR